MLESTYNLIIFIAFGLFALSIIVKHYEEFQAMRAAVNRIQYKTKLYKYFLIFFSFILFMAAALFQNSVMHVECDSAVTMANVTGNITHYTNEQVCIEHTIPGNSGIMYLYGALAMISAVLFIIWVIQAFGDGAY